MFVCVLCSTRKGQMAANVERELEKGRVTECIDGRVGFQNEGMRISEEGGAGNH